MCGGNNTKSVYCITPIVSKHPVRISSEYIYLLYIKYINNVINNGNLFD